MRRLRSLLTTVARRGLAQMPVVLAAWLLLVSSVALFSAAVSYGDETVRAGLADRIAAASPADRGITIKATVPVSSFAGIGTEITKSVGDALGPAVTEVDGTLRTGGLAAAGTPSDDVSHLTVLAAYERLAQHASLDAGRWPTAGGTPVEATLSAAGAASLGVAVGDRLRLESRVTPGLAIAVLIVGVWHAAPGDAYWSGDDLERTGTEALGRYVYRGPVMIEAADLAAWQDAPIAAEWRLLVAPDRLPIDSLDPFAAAVQGLPDRLAASVPLAAPYAVASGLPPILAAAGRGALVSRAAIVALTLQFGLLGAYAVLLVAGFLADRRRAETAQWRSRGAGGGTLIGLAFCEAIALAIPGALVGSFVGGRLEDLVTAITPLTASSAGGTAHSAVAAPLFASPPVAAATALVSIVVLIVPTLATGPLAGVRAAMNRQVGSTLAQRLGMDIVLVVVAAIAMWQLHQYGAPLTRDIHGSFGVDPLLVAAPALGLLAAALLAMRLGPRLSEVIDRRASDSRDAVMPLLAHQLGRRPLRHTRAGLLMILAASLVTFVAGYSSTWAQSQRDQAVYQSAADARASIPAYSIIPLWAAGSVIRSIPGVEAAVPIGQQTISVGQALRDGNLLSLDAEAAPTVASLPADAAAALNTLAASRLPIASIALPSDAAALEVTIDAHLSMPPDPTGLEYNGLDLPPRDLSDGHLTVSVVIANADGLARFDGAEAKLDGGVQSVAVPLSQTIDGVKRVPSFPIRLVSIEMSVSAPSAALDFGYPAVPVSGSLAVRSIAVLRGSGGEATALASPTEGWRWSKGLGEQTSYTSTKSDPGSIDVSSKTPIARFAWDTPPTVTVRYSAVPLGTSTLSAIASNGLLRTTDASVGDTVLGSVGGNPFALQIIAATETFPPLDPTVMFAVIDRTTLDLATYATTGEFEAATAWWLKLEPGADVAAALAQPPIAAASVVQKSTLLASRAADPLAIAVAGTLGLGVIAAILIAAIGFLASVAVSAAERRYELALLRALGLSRRALAGSLALENALVLAFGLVAGAGLGALLAWLVLPNVSFTASGAPPVPTPEVVVPWPIVAAVITSVGLVLVAATAMLAWRATAGDVAAAIRGLDE